VGRSHSALHLPLRDMCKCAEQAGRQADSDSEGDGRCAVYVRYFYWDPMPTLLSFILEAHGSYPESTLTFVIFLSVTSHMTGHGFILRHNHFILRHNHFILGHNHFIVRHNHFLLRHNHFILKHNHFILGRSHFILGRNHFILGHNHFILRHNHFILRHNHFILRQPLHTRT